MEAVYCAQLYKVEIAFGERNVVIFRRYKEFTAFVDKVGSRNVALYD